MTYCNAVTIRREAVDNGEDSYRLHRCYVAAKVGHRQTPYKAKPPPEMVGVFAFVLKTNSDLLELSDHLTRNGWWRCRLNSILNVKHPQVRP